MTWPDQDEVAGLIVALREATAAREAAVDEARRLQVAEHVAKVVLHFLLSNPTIRDEHLTRPLADAWAGLHDSGRGATVALLDHQPPEPGKPTRLLHDSGVAHLAFALEILASAGGTERSAVWLAAEARRLRVRAVDGGAIFPGQLVNWRKDLRRSRGTAKATQEFELLMARYSALHRAPKSAAKAARCRRVATAVVSNLANLLPAAVPASPRRVKNR